MSILEKLSSLYAPFTCMGCDDEVDRLLCDTCVLHIARVPSRCYLCRTTTRNYQICSRCRTKTPLQAVAVWGCHDGFVKELVHRAKYERAFAGLREIADHMIELLPFVKSDDMVIVPVPTASSRVRERGYDQAVVLAKYIAKHSALPYSRSLVRLNQAHQVGATRTERKRHVFDAFRVRSGQFLGAKNILLIDDVCTTGATLEEAARCLKAAGAKSVRAIVFSQPN